MILGFKRDNVDYVVASAQDRSADIFMRRILKHPTNYPIKRINKFPGCVVAGGKGSLELHKLCDLLENLDCDSISYEVLYNEVLPALRKSIKSDCGIYDDSFLNESFLIYYEGVFYTILSSGLVDIAKVNVLSNSIDKRNIAREAIDKYKGLEVKEMLSKIDRLCTSLNYITMAPYFIYRSDSDEIEVMEVYE